MAVVSLILGNLRPVEAQRIDPAALTQQSRRISLLAIDRAQRIGLVAASESTDVSQRQATVIGGIVGAVVGGLAGAVIGIRHSAYGCVYADCHPPDRTVLYASTGLVVGGSLGAWFAHSLFRER